ncbi:hypothetical protein Tsubulata_037047 [Turnera subulata]|uniref:GATA-type domain-containing protein n=1 Tax=Turnera subulata TaxID=218843 RepID=A0A9Q0J7Q5_9ROSI|nr:hypothetical protein Tsubulata_037047 [Turnera subulata]
MAVEDTFNDDVPDLKDLADLSFPDDDFTFPDDDFLGGSVLCVPDDPIESIALYPDFHNNPISLAQLDSWDSIPSDFDFLPDNVVEGTRTSPQPLRDYCSNNNEVVVVGKKQPRSKRSYPRKQPGGWSRLALVDQRLCSRDDQVENQNPKGGQVLSSSENEGWSSAVVRNEKGLQQQETAAKRRRCTHCQTDQTPQWRRGPHGPKSLCNACGVRYASGRLVPEYRPAASPTFDVHRHSNFHKKIIKKREGEGDLAYYY